MYLILPLVFLAFGHGHSPLFVVRCQQSSILYLHMVKSCISLRRTTDNDQRTLPKKVQKILYLNKSSQFCKSCQKKILFHKDFWFPSQGTLLGPITERAALLQRHLNKCIQYSMNKIVLRFYPPEAD